MTALRVLIGCEESGVVRRTFPGIASAMAMQWGGAAMIAQKATP